MAYTQETLEGYVNKGNAVFSSLMSALKTDSERELFREGFFSIISAQYGKDSPRKTVYALKVAEYLAVNPITSFWQDMDLCLTLMKTGLDPQNIYQRLVSGDKIMLDKEEVKHQERKDLDKLIEEGPRGIFKGLNPANPEKAYSGEGSRCGGQWTPEHREEESKHYVHDPNQR